MTALSDYAKLEAEAIFHDAASGKVSEVVLSFGERSLIIMSLDDRPLAHWPLVTLHGRGAEPDGTTEIAPDRTAEDYITLTDNEMIAAIRAVCPNLYDEPEKPPIPRRVTLRWLGAVMLVLVVAAGLAMPRAIAKITKDISAEQETRLGLAMRPLVIDNLSARGQVRECTSPEGHAALMRLVERIATGPGARFFVLDMPIAGTLVLPGGDVLIFRGMLDRASTPEALAGVLSHQVAHVSARHALQHSVAHFGLIDLVKLWWGAEPDEEVIETATAAFLSQAYAAEAEQAADTRALAALAAAALPTRPFADNLSAWAAQDKNALSFSVRHPSSNRAEAARAADTIGDAAFRPALDDRSWLALANICDERSPFD